MMSSFPVHTGAPVAWPGALGSIRHVPALFVAKLVDELEDDVVVDEAGVVAGTAVMGADSRATGVATEVRTGVTADLTAVWAGTTRPHEDIKTNATARPATVRALAGR